jgi:hypothetical protein
MMEYRFGTEQRQNSEEKMKRSIPGPGAYDHSGVIGKDGPSKSIANKLNDTIEWKENNSKPGPG